MAIRVRITGVTNATPDNPVVSANVELFESTTGAVSRSGVITMPLSDIEGQTGAQARTRLEALRDGWGSEQKELVTRATRLDGAFTQLVGVDRSVN